MSAQEKKKGGMILRNDMIAFNIAEINEVPSQFTERLIIDPITLEPVIVRNASHVSITPAKSRVSSTEKPLSDSEMNSFKSQSRPIEIPQTRLRKTRKKNKPKKTATRSKRKRLVTTGV